MMLIRRIILLLGLMLSPVQLVNAQILLFSTVEGSVNQIAKEVMVEAYGRLGITIHTVVFPPQRALYASNSGVVDGELFRKAGISESYPNLIALPVPIVTIEEMVFTTVDRQFVVDGWKSLLPYTVGYRNGIKVIEENLIEGTVSESVPSLEQLFKKLEAGRNNVVIETRISGTEVIKRLGLTDVVMLTPPLIKSPLYHYLHIRNKHLLEPLTNVLQEMEQEGLISEIQNRVLNAESVVPVIKSSEE